jgi:ankyrin repeat protein
MYNKQKSISKLKNSDGLTPLMLASKLNSLALVNFLSLRTPNLNACDKDGKSILME